MVKTGELPFPLTKRQCHRVLASHQSSDFLTAVRAAQFADLSDDRRLLGAWLSSEIGPRVHPPKTEEFFLTFVRLCAQTPRFNPDAFEPLLDYLRHRRRENTDLSLKGRTIQSLVRGMEEWHTELHQSRAHLADGKTVFPSSGFNEAVYSASVRNKGADPIHRTWRIREILTPKDLHLEGKKQRHCVASYARFILENRTSIWSLTVNEGFGPERALTFQLQNQQKSVVQIRGFANRRAKNSELKIIVRWAKDNGLTVTSSA
jgi:hypothetical protein